MINSILLFSPFLIIQAAFKATMVVFILPTHPEYHLKCLNIILLMCHSAHVTHM